MKNILFLIFLFNVIQMDAQLIHFVVAKDGSGTDTTIQSALDKCPENIRSIIYIKNGQYKEHISIGSKAVASKKIISLIGENRDSVIVYWDKSMGSVSTFEEATCLQVYAKNFYAENITFSNTAGNTGQALALYNAGDGFILNKCTITGYQDTYRSKKGTRGYIRNSKISGATDFIYAGGTVIIDDSELLCVMGGGYICAPEDAAYFIEKYETTCKRRLGLEYIFRNCSITAEEGVADGSYYLGRPWGSPYSSAYYLNCKMGTHIQAKGWQTWDGNESTAVFAEYNSMDLNGLPIDTTGRASWSFQLPKADVDKFLTPQVIYARVSSTVFDPIPATDELVKPNVGINTQGLFWKSVPNAIGYMILQGGQFYTTTTDTVFTDMTMGMAAFSVKAIGSMGQLSQEGSLVMGLENNSAEREFNQLGNHFIFNFPTDIKVYDLNGKIVFSELEKKNAFKLHLPSGVYILSTEKQNYKIRI